MVLNIEYVHKCIAGEVAEAVTSIESTFSTGKSFGIRDFLEGISKSALFSQSVWVAEEMRIIAKQGDGPEALKELGVDPQRAIAICYRY